MPDMFFQQLVNGLVLGATYALFALGFTLIFGVVRVLNLTYGFYFSLGAFIALYLRTALGISIWVALPLAAAGSGLVAIVIDAALLTRLARAKAAELSTLMVTLGAVLFLYALSGIVLGTGIRRFPEGTIGNAAFTLGPIRVVETQILIVAATAVLVAALLLLLRATRLGLAIRAVAENPDAARLMGINRAATMATVSFLSGALGGAAGVLIGLNFNAIQPYMGESMMLRGFAVVIIGGLGDIRGALLAGVLLGVLEVMGAAYVTSSFKEAIAFGALVLTLWLRPVGLFGRPVARRA